MTDHFSRDELLAMGIRSVGAPVWVDRSVRFFGPERISMGSRVRIDCFAILSAGTEGIRIGSHVHIAAGCFLFGSGGEIVLEDFAGLSSRVSVYTASDDYLGGHLTNPTVPDEYRKIQRGRVHLGRHVIVGSGAVLLPGVSLGAGAAVGALTVVRKSVPNCAIVYGNPMQRLPGSRDGQLLSKLEGDYLSSLAGDGGEGPPEEPR